MYDKSKKEVPTSMTKEVLLTIKGLQVSPEDESDTVEMLAPGEYYYRNDKHFVLYDEVTEGQEEITQNIIKFQEDYMEITKKGPCSVHMIFEKNKKNVTYYYTPYGSLLIGIDAHEVQIEEQEDLIGVQVEYSLEVNCEHIANCNITVQVRPKGAFVKL